MATIPVPALRLKARGANSNPHNRFVRQHSEAVDDGWARKLEELPRLDFETRLFYKVNGVELEAELRQPGYRCKPIASGLNKMPISPSSARSAWAGATRASSVMLRLQHELKDLFGSWLKTHYPERASLVISLIRQLHGGRDYDSRFGTRQTGNGTLAQLIAQRFELACRRHTLARGSEAPLNTDLFKSPSRPGDQFKLL